MLENPEEVANSSLEEWKEFLLKLYKKLINIDFESQKISFNPEMSKIQIYKLRKNNPCIPDILITKSPGYLVDIPKI